VKAARSALLAAVLLCAAAGAAAQQRPASPVADVLRRARRALDNLQYAAADSLARSVLLSAAPVSRAERVDALLITVAALYPEERRAQRADSAMAFLRRYVAIAPDGAVPRAISWRGLDSLMELARRTTFAAVARPRPADTLTGTGAVVRIPVVATRPTRFSLRLGGAGAPAGGELLDSAGPATEGALALRLFEGDRAVAPSGDWVLTVTAVDALRPDTIVQRFPMTVAAPPLDLVPVPAALDTAELRAEWARPSRGLGVAIGAGLGGAAIVMAQAFRADEPVGSATGADSRAFLMAGGFAIGGVVGALLDKGHPLPLNVAYNNRIRAAFAQRVLDAQRENDRRREAWRATVTIGEARP
jgi:hypothetical protein